jgi:hypothetical protein
MLFNTSKNNYPNIEYVITKFHRDRPKRNDRITRLWNDGSKPSGSKLARNQYGICRENQKVQFRPVDGIEPCTSWWFVPLGGSLSTMAGLEFKLTH